ncbi:MAG: alpha/beta hydrolase [Gammaproteobacteria bacterium]|nr:MAG: alpha/beta hydrolase [Gammaproteobacteria bacterium]
MPYTSNNGVNIYFETYGEGEPIVLIRGLGGTVSGWASQVRHLSDDYQTILIDNRGAGESDKPDEEYSLDIFALDLKSVLDEIGIKKTHILGLSMGGFIVQRFYSLYPEMVQSMTLGCTGTGLSDPAHIMFTPELEEILNTERTDENRDYLISKMNEYFFHPEFAKNNQKFMEMVFLDAKNKKQPAHAYMRQFKACYSDTHLSPLLKNINVPTSILHGDEDVVVPIENAHFLHQNIEGSELNIFHKAGHMFFLEKEQEFNSTVREFIQRHPM